MITAEGEKVRGRQLSGLLETLVAQQTLIRLKIRGFGYDRLTVVKGLRRNQEGLHVVLDLPEGLQESIGEVQQWKNDLEFTGPDGLQYTCTSAAGRLYLGDIWVRIPEYVLRVQRRKSFRLEAPSGSLLHCRRDDRKEALEIVDISLGGTLCTVAEGIQGRLPEPGQRLCHVQVEFPSEEEDLRVHVREAVVLRLQEDPRPGRYQMAIQFVDIERTEKKALTELIYRFQRRYLRTRIRM